MAEVRITRDFTLDKWIPKLRFADGKPVVVAYCRVSTEDQADEGYSLDTQQEKDREACDRKFGRGCYHIVYIVVDEHGPLPFDRGGMAKGTYREGLTLAVEIFRAGLAQYLCVYKMNRITRSLRIYLELDEDVLQPNNVEIFSATEPISNRTAAARFFTSIIGASAENEHANIIAVSRDGLRSRMEKGFYTGQVPYGWRWDGTRQRRKNRFARNRPKTDHDKPRRNIEPDPETSPVVKRIHALCAQGKTNKQIADELNCSGIRTARGTSRWTQGGVGRILRNPTHAGLVRLDDKLVEGRHFDKRIIDPADYYAACKRLAGQARLGPPLKRSTNHIFAEFTRCAICGRRMRVQARPRGPRYECWGNDGDVRHRAYSVRIAWVEKGVVESIAALASDTVMLDAASGRVAALIDAEHSQVEVELKRVTSELARCEDALLRWCERFNDTQPGSEGDDGGVVFQLYRDKLVSDITRIKGRIVELQGQDTDRLARSAQLEQALSLLGEFESIWNDMDLSEKRALAGHIIEELSFEPDGPSECPGWVKVNLRLILREPEVFRIPTRGRGGRASTGLDSLSATELTNAYYYMKGCSDADIAQERDVSIATVRGQKCSLIRRTGVATLEEALEMVAPLVEARSEELRLGQRSGRHYREHFTEAQVEALRLLAQRLSTRDIAEHTRRSVGTAYKYLCKLYRKLGVGSRAEAVAEARRRHIIDGPTPWSSAPTGVRAHSP